MEIVVTCEGPQHVAQVKGHRMLLIYYTETLVEHIAQIETLTLTCKLCFFI